MLKLYLINYSFVAQLAKRTGSRNPKLAEGASFVSCLELFFAGLALEFIIIALLPFEISPYLLGAVGLVIWYYTSYPLRSMITKTIFREKIPQNYKKLESGRAKWFFVLSLLLFWGNFFLFFAITVWTLEGYYK